MALKKPCQEQAVELLPAGRSSSEGRIPSCRSGGSRLNQEVKVGQLWLTGPGPSTTLAVTYRSQPGPTLHLRSSKYLTGDSVCLAQSRCWDLSIYSGWTLFPRCPGWWCWTEPFPFCFKVCIPFSYVLTVFLQCLLSQVAQPSTPLVRRGVLLCGGFYCLGLLLCCIFLRITCFWLSILTILESSCKLQLPLYFVSTSECKLFGQGMSAIP